MSNQPAHKIRFSNLSVTIWRNTSIEKGTPGTPSTRAAATRRATKPGRKRDSLGIDDLLIMAELLRQAFSWIARQMQADSKARKARQDANSSDE